MASVLPSPIVDGFKGLIRGVSYVFLRGLGLEVLEIVVAGDFGDRKA